MSNLVEAKVFVVLPDLWHKTKELKSTREAVKRASTKLKI